MKYLTVGIQIYLTTVVCKMWLSKESLKLFIINTHLSKHLDNYLFLSKFSKALS